MEGLKFTQFYSGDSMCSPARAALLTGRLPIRTGMVGGYRVTMVNDTGGLPANESTIADLLRLQGYRTGMVGKWHLGINKFNRTDGSHLPKHHGFDFVGKNLPFSIAWSCDESGIFRDSEPDTSWCFLYDGDTMYQQPIHFETLTQSFVDDFKRFIDEAPEPFFFYFSFPHVHTALWASKAFLGKSKRGLFGDNLNEMAWAVSEVRNTLIAKGLERNTLVLFLSDHGPHVELCKYGGLTAGFLGGKSNSYEGGFRVPAIAWWPGIITPGTVSHDVFSALDILPTLVTLANGSLPSDRFYDGISFHDVLKEPSSKFSVIDSERPIFFYCNKTLMAIRLGGYKVHYNTQQLFLSSDMPFYCPGGVPIGSLYISMYCNDDVITIHDPPLVFNVETDPYEQFPLNVTLDKNWSDVLDRISHVRVEHEKTLQPVPDQLGYFNEDVIPCCDFPNCRCNYNP